MAKKIASEKPTSIFPLLLGTGLGAMACYAFVNLTQYGIAILCMMGLVFVLGASNQLKRSNALIINIILSGLACGSIILFSMELESQAMIARALSFLIFAFVGLSVFGALLKIVFALGAMGMLVFLIGYAMKNVDNQELSDNDVTEEPIGNDNPKDELIELTEETADEAPSPNDKLHSHLQQWRDYDFNSYQGKLEVWQSNYQESTNFKDKKLRPKNTSQASAYWNSVYTALVNHDTEYMERILDTFIRIGKSKKLNELEFAQVIVSCVQSIPYVLICRESCESLAQSNPSLAELAKQHSCKGNVSYGLQSPTEFMYDFKGDCDTRTVFLFTILDKLGYKVAILNSDKYGHSMLGLATTATGKYKTHQGINYYFWETTAAGWNIGTLPPDMGQPSYWYVVLAN